MDGLSVVPGLYASDVGRRSGRHLPDASIFVVHGDNGLFSHFHGSDAGSAPVSAQLQEQVHLRYEHLHGDHVDVRRHVQDFVLYFKESPNSILGLWFVASK